MALNDMNDMNDMNGIAGPALLHMRNLNAASAVQDALCASKCCSQALDADLSQHPAVFGDIMYRSSEDSEVCMQHLFRKCRSNVRDLPLAATVFAKAAFAPCVPSGCCGSQRCARHAAATR